MLWKVGLSSLDDLYKAGFPIRFTSPTFNEFVVEFPAGFAATYTKVGRSDETGAARKPCLSG